LLQTDMAGKKISKAFSSWQKGTLDPAKARVKNRVDTFETSSGIALSDLDLPDEKSFSEENYLEKVGFPGVFPYTRGVQPTMYRPKRWTMRQYAGFATPEETNKRYRYLLGQVTTGLSIAFDLPTQMGRDSDEKRAQGEVGRVGVPVS